MAENNNSNHVAVTQEDIVNKTAELTELLKNFEGSRSDAAQHICFEAIVWGTDNHFEALGVLEETKLAYREASLEALDDKTEENFDNSDGAMN